MVYLAPYFKTGSGQAKSLNLEGNPLDSLVNLKYLTEITELRLGGSQFDFNELIDVQISATGTSYSTPLNITNFYVSKCYRLDNDDVLAGLFKIYYYANKSLNIYIDETTTAWNPYEKLINKKMSYLPSIISFNELGSYDLFNTKGIYTSSSGFEIYFYGIKHIFKASSSKIYTRFTNKYSWQNNNDYFDITNGTINYKKLIASNETSYLVSQIIEEVLPIEYIKGFVCLSGPSFAEEIMHRKVTLLVSASKDSSDASYIQQLFNNPNYVRVYTSSDMIGVEVCGAVKNAIALISGVCQGLDLGMNARAALLTRSNREIIEIVKAMGGEESTCYGLTGIGDLMLTASSTLSRNFQAGMRIGNGETLESVIENSKNVVEGVRAVKACEEIRIKYNLELPILSMAYKVLYDHLDVKVAVKILLSRELKSE